MNERVLTRADIERLAIGAGILGTGGGGSPYLGTLQALALLDAGNQVTLVPMSSVPDDALVVSVGGMGAPTIGIERIVQGEEMANAVRALERRIGRRFTHLIAAEIGGGNAISPLIVGAQLGLPVIDGDGMGRAFPELQMDTYMIAGIPPTPAALASYEGHEVIFADIADAQTVERYARVTTIAMGGSAGLAMPVMTGAEVRGAAIAGTASLAIAIGDAVLRARREKTDPVAAALTVSGGACLFRGKATDVARRNEGGFARGVLRIDGSGDDAGRTLTIDIQNEYLIARDGEGRVLAVVPDLVCLVDEDTGEPIGTEAIRYGLRVAVLGIPAPVELKTPEALAVVGPAAFGYHDVTFTPMPGTYGAGLR
jgi:uncharacterized protein